MIGDALRQIVAAMAMAAASFRLAAEPMAAFGRAANKPRKRRKRPNFETRLMRLATVLRISRLRNAERVHRYVRAVA